PLLVLLFSFSPLLPPPTSTLFPYTTLFRSRAYLRQTTEKVDGTSRDMMSRARGLVVELRSKVRTGDRREPWAPETSSEAHGSRRDRKSTRLNSSHVSISYAVFCLKKKKKKT